jgi:hypothetical protein
MKRLATVLLVLAMVLGGAAVAAAPATAAASCSASGCTGLDPQSMGCSPGAITLESKEYNGVWMELRYNSDCYAAWTRYERICCSTFIPPATAYIRGSGHTYSKNLAGWVGEKGWTKMVSFEEYVRSCVMVYKDGGYVQDCTPEH